MVSMLSQRCLTLFFNAQFSVYSRVNLETKPYTNALFQIAHKHPILGDPVNKRTSRGGNYRKISAFGLPWGPSVGSH